AYSSIAQAGYMLLPFALVGASHAIDAKAFQAVELYILIYGVMNLGAFAVVTAVARESPRLLVEDFAGLVRRAPVIAIAMTLFLEGEPRPFRSPALVTGVVVLAAVAVFAIFVYPDMFARFPPGATLVTGR